MTYIVHPDDELDQGDLIRRIVVTAKAPITLEEPPALLTSNVVVLSHGCDIDKARFDSVLVARVIRLSAIPDRGMAGNVRRNRVYEAFYLPAVGPVAEDVYIDWRTIQAVDKQVLLEARPSARYIASLDSEFLAAASDGLWRFFFRLHER